VTRSYARQSTQRQYALRHRAIAAGWPAERVRVIDRDLGKSGSTAVARDGFQELVSEVALAKAGIVMGLEVSRLARRPPNSNRETVPVDGGFCAGLGIVPGSTIAALVVSS
jgi:DNA invertase Pin-like site-specific DNA recombinase